MGCTQSNAATGGLCKLDGSQQVQKSSCHGLGQANKDQIRQKAEE